MHVGGTPVEQVVQEEELPLTHLGGQSQAVMRLLYTYHGVPLEAPPPQHTQHMPHAMWHHHSTHASAKPVVPYVVFREEDVNRQPSWLPGQRLIDSSLRRKPEERQEEAGSGALALSPLCDGAPCQASPTATNTATGLHLHLHLCRRRGCSLRTWHARPGRVAA